MRRLLNFVASVHVLGLAVCVLALAGCSSSTQKMASSSPPAGAGTEADDAAAVRVDDPAVGEEHPAATVATTESEAIDDSAEPAADVVASDSERASTAGTAPTGRVTREAAKPVVAEYAEGVPPVLLSAGHAALSRIKVGDMLPTIELPKLGGGNANLESLAGSKATVVLFWTKDVWMSRMALGDLQRDVAAHYPAGEVGVVGVAVGASDDVMAKALELSGSKFPQLVDAQGQAASQLGEGALPRVYVIDGERRVAWFDIEYSESSRREIGQTLTVLAGEQ